jgi:hypothetical protein
VRIIARRSAIPVCCGSRSCEVDRQVRGDGGRDRVEEAPKLNGALPTVALANDPAAHHFERGEERRRPIADIVVRAALRLPGTHRQQRLSPVERLDLRLLIDAKHEGPRGWIDADDVADLLHEQRIGRELEGLRAVGLRPEGPPDPRERCSD